MGAAVWPRIEFEADDALASAAAKAAKDDRAGRVLICTPEKNLSQCVVGTRVVQLDRRHDILRDEAGALARFALKPRSMPDYLAVVGDHADGFPGVAGWGSASCINSLVSSTSETHVPGERDERDCNARSGERNREGCAGSFATFTRGDNHRRVHAGGSRERARNRERDSPGTQSEAGEFGGRLRMFFGICDRMLPTDWSGSL
jgi:hypothetical protein